MREGHARGTRLRKAPADDIWEVWAFWLSVRDVGFKAKVVQIGPKWDKYRACSDQISIYYFNFPLVSQNILKSGLKKSRIYPIPGQSDPVLIEFAGIIINNQMRTKLNLMSP